MMTDYTILLKARAWGCKIKSSIDALLNLDKSELKQGEDIKLGLNIKFNPEDLPKSIEISLEEKESHGFILNEPIKQDISEPEVTLDLLLKYKDGQTGNYNIELNFRHAEYGTELAQVLPAKFSLSTPVVQIIYCKADTDKVSAGQNINLIIGLNSPAPQKIRGIVFGRLSSHDALNRRNYELEPKRLSIIGEKEIVWPLEISHDETKTGRLNAIIEFKSKDSFTKQDYESIIEIRNKRSLNVNELSGSNQNLSAGDEQIITASMENIGLEVINFEIHPVITILGKVMAKSNNKPKKEDGEVLDVGSSGRWSLPIQTMELAPDDKCELSWNWKLPENVINGKYEVKLVWKDLHTGRTSAYSRELFSVKSHHEIKILDAIISAGSVSAGEDAEFRILLSDSGTRAGETLEIECRVFDILNQEIFNKSENDNIEPESTECIITWPIPDNIDSGKYDLKVRILANDTELTSRKFSKFINIELPAKLEIHAMLPGITNRDREIGKYLIENEQITKTIKHKSLTIYNLNSNTQLFVHNNNLINYSIDRKTSPEQLQEFGNDLFSYLLIKEYINSDMIKSELDSWLKIGYLWSSLILSDEEFLNIGKSGLEANKIKELLKQTPSNSSLERIYQIVYKDFLKTKDQVKLEKLFNKSVLKDPSIKNSDEFKLFTSIIKYLAASPKSQNIQEINDLNKIFRSAIKFRKAVNSKLLQKKFNHALMSWVGEIKRGRIKHKPDLKKYEIFRAGYSYLLFYLTVEIINNLRNSKHNKYLPPSKFTRLILFEILYYYILMNFYNTEAKYNPYSVSRESNIDQNRALGELRNAVQKFWFFHRRWQIMCKNYLKNMANRGELAFIHEHVKITTNPVLLHGMRGGHGKTKLILGNNGIRAIALYPHLALPSQHWNLVEPEATLVNNLYQLKRIVIAPKQTKEISLAVAFPQTLSFDIYSGILKLNSKHINLITEIDKE
jgi:hypothetical protein